MFRKTWNHTHLLFFTSYPLDQILLSVLWIYGQSDYLASSCLLSCWFKPSSSHLEYCCSTLTDLPVCTPFSKGSLLKNWNLFGQSSSRNCLVASHLIYSTSQNLDVAVKPILFIPCWFCDPSPAFHLAFFLGYFSLLALHTFLTCFCLGAFAMVCLECCSLCSVRSYSHPALRPLL
jgi:hypothetical protein